MIIGLEDVEDAAYEVVRALTPPEGCPICKTTGSEHEVYCDVRVLFGAIDNACCDGVHW